MTFKGSKEFDYGWETPLQTIPTTTQRCGILEFLDKKII